MKKEVLIAIVIGFLVGLIITYGVHTAQSSLSAQKEQGDSALSPTSNSSLTDPAGDGTHSLIIYSPQNDEIVTTSTIQISGISSPKSMVAAVTAGDHDSTVADSQGSFVLQLDLDAGANQIELSSYAVTGEMVTETFSLIYSTADLSRTASASASINTQGS